MKFNLLQRLNESLNIISTLYGTNENVNNSEILTNEKYAITFFKSGMNYYCVALNKMTGEISFGASPYYSNNADDYSDNRLKATNIFEVFGKVIWLMIQLANKIGRETLYFEAKDIQLDKVYNKILGNNYLLQQLKNNGWEFYKKHNNRYIFGKITHG